jgi:hypothetical protein
MIGRNNPRWGAPRIHGELMKLGIEINEPTVAKYMVRQRKPPSQTWRTFLENHVRNMVSVDSLQNHEERNCQARAASSSYESWAVCTIITNAGGVNTRK